jgi:hypothetical protein
VWPGVCVYGTTQEHTTQQHTCDVCAVLMWLGTVGVGWVTVCAARRGCVRGSVCTGAGVRGKATAIISLASVMGMKQSARKRPTAPLPSLCLSTTGLSWRRSSARRRSAWRQQPHSRPARQQQQRRLQRQAMQAAQLQFRCALTGSCTSRCPTCALPSLASAWVLYQNPILYRSALSIVLADQTKTTHLQCCCWLCCAGRR